MAPSPLGKACLTRQSYLAGARQIRRRVCWRQSNQTHKPKWPARQVSGQPLSGDLASKCAATGGTYPDSIPSRTAGAPHSCTEFCPVGRKQTRALTHTNTRHTDFTNCEQPHNPIFFDKLAPTCEYFKKPGQHRFC